MDANRELPALDGMALLKDWYGTREKKLRACVAAALSALFLRAPFAWGVYPLAPALFAAGGLADFLPLLLGGAVSLFLGRSDRVPLLSAVLMVLLVRIFSSSRQRCRLFSESQGARILSAASGALLFSLYRLAAGGMRLYDVWGLALGVSVASAGAFFFSGVSESREAHRVRGGFALAVAAVYALRTSKFLLFSPSLALGGAVVSLAIYAFGAGGGAILGLFVGLASGEVTTALTLGGLCGGKISEYERRAGLVVFLLVTVVYQSFTADFFAAMQTMASLSVGAVTVFFFGKKQATKMGTADATPIPKNPYLSRLVASMHTLSETLSALANRLRTPTANGVVARCEADCKVCCRSCMYEATCWSGDDPPIRMALLETTREMERNVSLAGARFARHVPRDCPQQEGILQILRATTAAMREKMTAEDRVAVCAETYARMARLYAAAEEAGTIATTENSTMETAVRAALARAGLDAREVAVYGERLPRILLTDVSGLAADHAGRSMQAAKLAAALAMPLTPFSVRETTAGTEVETARAPAFAARLSVRGEEKTKDGISGDLVAEFTSDDGYYFALLCDGMGSGREAALRARLSKVFARELLGAGCSAADTLAAISDVLRYTPGECFSTLDLLVVDLLTGGGKFIKSGASASYVLREGQLFRMASCSLPLGICEESAPEETTFVFAAGDVVVMQSDGISGEDDTWLVELLREDRGEGTERLLARTLAMAKRMHPQPDDRTVCAVELFAI